MTNENQPAFPFNPYKELVDDFADEFRANGGINPIGLTKREYFAAKALQGLMTTLIPLENNHSCPNLENVKYCAELSVKAADELLEQLKNNP
jgi:hypothetical protein